MTDPNPPKSATVLIVEDDPDIQCLIQTVLEQSKITVVACARDGEEGVALYEKHRPALVLMDVRMPRMDGITALKKIRSADPEAVVVILTAHRSVDTAVESFRSHAFEYLDKPFKPATLIQVTRRGLIEARKKRLTQDLYAHFASFDPDLDAFLGIVVVDGLCRILQIDDRLLRGRPGKSAVGTHVKDCPEIGYLVDDLVDTVESRTETHRRWAVLGLGEQLRILRYSTQHVGYEVNEPAAFGVVIDQTSRKRAELRSRHEEREAATTELALATQTQIGRHIGNLEGYIAELEMGIVDLASSSRPNYTMYCETTTRNYTSMKDHLRQIHQIIERFSDFSRGATASQSLFDLNRILRETCEAVLEVRGKRIQHTYELEKGKLLLRGDPRDIAAAVTTLLDNACRAMKGAGELLIQSSQSKTMIKILIADSGCGLTPDQEEKIFQPFHSGWGDGSKGLGLAVARKTIEDLGGLITVESEPGVGSLFSIILPRPQLSEGENSSSDFLRR